MPWLAYVNLSMSCCQEEQPCLPLPAPITSPVPVLVLSMCTVSFTTELLQPTLGCQTALRSTSLGPEREACSGLTYFVQAPYTITVCAELSLVHPDPIGDTVHSLDLHSWSKTKSISVWPLRPLNMQRPYWTSLSTQQDALDVPMAPKTQQGLSSIYGNGGSS